MSAASASSSPSSSLVFAGQSLLFSSLGLDTRLWKSLASRHFIRLTLVQAEAIPKILQGSNVLVKAPTGSGKTLAYAIPLVQQVLLAQQSADDGLADIVQTPRGTSRIVLLPTPELCDQVKKTVESLLKYCDDCVKVLALKPDVTANGVAKPDPTPIRNTQPDILITTPAQLLAYCKHSAAIARKNKAAAYLADLPETLKHLVIDEADHVLSMGYESELTELLNNSSYLGKGYQISLLSATLDDQIEQLRNLYVPDPAIIDVAERSGGLGRLKQLYADCTNLDKYLLTYSFLKGGIGPLTSCRKLLFFFNSIPDAYRLKLFLEHFGIQSAVLNHELPYNSRQSILDHFNRGVFDILIATDQATGEGEAEEDDEAEEEKKADKKQGKKRKAGKVKEEDDDDEEQEGDSKKKQKTSSGSAAASSSAPADELDAVSAQLDADLALLETLNESSNSSSDRKDYRRGAGARGSGSSSSAKHRGGHVSRGIDFIDVDAVINFDFPLSVKNYVHRVGRTARGRRSGIALTLVNDAERPLLEALQAMQVEQAIRRGMPPADAVPDLVATPFSRQDVDAFRYRFDDVIRRVTKVSIREARLKEIKLELLNSEKLRTHFEDNPRELALIKHDQVLKTGKTQKHLAQVPDYLRPEGSQDAAAMNSGGMVGAADSSADKSRNRLRRQKHANKIAASNQAAKLGLDKLKGYALKKAKGRHTMAMKNANDPLRTFRAKPLYSATSNDAAASQTKSKVDF